MTTTDFTLGAIEQALAHLQSEKRITFEIFEAIMRFHVLETPGLEGLRHNFEQREWHLLSSQLRSFANIQQEALLDCVIQRIDPDKLYRQGMVIRMLRELSGAAGSIGYRAIEIGN